MYKFKNSDTIVIYGSGFSINDLTKKDIKELNRYDSLSLNWFCFSHIPVTYYIVREQANIPKRIHGKENVGNFYNIINKYYKNSCLILHDLSHHSPNAYNYTYDTSLFVPSYITVKDVKLKGNDPGVERWRKENILKDGIYHGKTTMTNTLHFAVWMGYKRIVFAGVDLYDSKYFWLKNNETRYSVKNKKKNMNSQHQAAKDTLSLVKKVKQVYPDIKMCTYNKKSLLSDIIDVWS